jgi:hypothetical protein
MALTFRSKTVNQRNVQLLHRPHRTRVTRRARTGDGIQLAVHRGDGQTVPRRAHLRQGAPHARRSVIRLHRPEHVVGPSPPTAMIRPSTMAAPTPPRAVSMSASRIQRSAATSRRCSAAEFRFVMPAGAVEDLRRGHQLTIGRAPDHDDPVADHGSGCGTAGMVQRHPGFPVQAVAQPEDLVRGDRGQTHCPARHTRRSPPAHPDS